MRYVVYIIDGFEKSIETFNSKEDAENEKRNAERLYNKLATGRGSIIGLAEVLDETTIGGD